MPPTLEQEVDPKVMALTDSLTNLYENSVLPGFAITIVKNEEILYQQAFGQADVAKDKKYTNQTTQPIGSISKTFIGVALLKAIEQGHFTLETNINEILPFEINNPHTPTIPIQVKHLVTHTAGFSDSGEAYDENYYIKSGENTLLPTSQLILSYGVSISDGMPLGDYLKAVYTPDGDLYDEDDFHEGGPGEFYEYSNISASLAAYLIEVKTNQSYASFVEEYILDPLGMANSAYDRSEVDPITLATLYTSKEYPLPEYSHPSYPDGFLNTSNEEMGLYLIEMIKGATGNGTLLAKESYQILFQQQSPNDLEDGEIHAVFWDLVDGRIEHNGGDPGVMTLLSFNPITQTGYYIMTNINGVDLASDLGVDQSIGFNQLFQVLGQVSAFEGTE